MKVKELIEALEMMNPELRVVHQETAYVTGVMCDFYTVDREKVPVYETDSQSVTIEECVVLKW